LGSFILDGYTLTLCVITLIPKISYLQPA